VQRSREYIAVGRTDLYEKLSNIVTRVYRSDANYILFYEPRLSSEALKAYRISVRDCSDYFGLGKGYFRTCVGLHENNEALVGAIKAILGKQTQQLNCEV
jgi:threonine-phosphate decarboxylase